jgi:hypothetical protein
MPAAVRDRDGDAGAALGAGRRTAEVPAADCARQDAARMEDVLMEFTVNSEALVRELGAGCIRCRHQEAVDEYC